jgi:hypothetical protein
MRSISRVVLILFFIAVKASASVQCLKGFDDDHCRSAGRRLLDVLTPMHAEQLMPKNWTYTIVSNHDWKELQNALHSPSEYAVSAPWLNRTFFRQATIEGLERETLEFVAAHEMAHIVCSIPMSGESKANIVAHRLIQNHSTDVLKLCAR